MGDQLATSPQPSVLAAAAAWLEAAITGSVAVSVAIIAIAATGLAMLSGRIDLRRGIATIWARQCSPATPPAPRSPLMAARGRGQRAPGSRPDRVARYLAPTVLSGPSCGFS